MTESNQTPGTGPFDAEKFAREAIRSIEYGDAMGSVLEERVIRIEEIIAARWFRSLFLRRRLAREIRASVATWDDDYIPRGDFLGRRMEAVGQMSSDWYDRRYRARERNLHGPGDGGPQDGGADPGAGYLP